MKIKIHLVPEDGLHVEGEEPPSILDIHEPLFRFEQPIHYALDITWVGERGLLAHGRLSLLVRARCVRTLEWFDLPIVVEDFQAHEADVAGDELDLTQAMREDILLLLPANPVLPQAKPLEGGLSPKPAGGSEVWGALNQLKLK